MKRAFTILLSITLIFILLLSAGCGKETDSKSTQSKKVSASDLKQFDEEVQELLTRNDDYEPKEPTAFANIAKARESGELTDEQWTILTILASYAPERLPKEYQGRELEQGRTNVQEALWYMNEHWDEFDEETQDILEPFYLLPNDPKSFFHPDFDKHETILKKMEIIPSVEAAGVTWKEVDYIKSENPVKAVFIFYPDNDTANKQKALWIKESMEKAWPMFENLLAKHPKHSVWMYITDTGSDYGSAEMKTFEGKDHCYVKISNKIDKKNTKSTASHELFHCFQYAMPMKYDKKPRMWMMEATATWSEHWVWPDYNKEWEYLEGFFSELDKDMITWNEAREYSTYMWYLYMTQMTGNIGIVKDDLVKVKTIDGRKVVTNGAGFHSFFADYALWNWNKDPKEIYQDAPKFPRPKLKSAKMTPNGPAYDKEVYDEKKQNFGWVDLGNLSIAYRVAAFDDSIDKVVYKFDQEGDEKHRRQALIKIGDIWHEEDWTYIKERKFCRTRDDEKVKSVVLIVSNSDDAASERYNLPYVVDTRGKCNPEWRGYTRWYFNFNTGWQVLYATTKYSKSSYMTSFDTLVYDEEEDEFVIKDQFISYYYNEHHATTFAQDCGMQYESIKKVYTGSTQSSWELDEDHPGDTKGALTRLDVDYDDETLYDVSLDEHEYGKEWIAYFDLRAKQRKACELEGLFTPSQGSYTTSEQDISTTDRFKTEPNDIKARLSDDGKRLYGEETQIWTHGDEEYPIHIVVDYRYG